MNRAKISLNLLRQIELRKIFQYKSMTEKKEIFFKQATGVQSNEGLGPAKCREPSALTNLSIGWAQMLHVDKCFNFSNTQREVIPIRNSIIEI